MTISRYLASLKAVLAPEETEEDHLEDPIKRESLRQFRDTDQIVEQFMLNEGPQLQRDLKEYANKCQNWVSNFNINSSRGPLR